MASTVKIKRSSVAGKVPTTSNIEAGELALNTADKVLYSTDGSSVFVIGSNLDTLSVNNHIEFTPRDADAPSHAEGRVFYHDEYKALTVYNDISDVSLQVGHEEWVRVYNNTGSQIDNGTPLYVTGASGEMPTVAPADATTEAKARVIGVATHDIADSSSGVATTRGLVSGINTSSLTAGQSIHVGASGALQTAAPTYPYWPVDIGECIVSDATNGYIYVQIREHHFESFRVSGNQHNDGNLTIDGNLTVNGTQTITSQNNLSINDSFIYLNSGDNIGESGTTFTGTGLDDAYFRGYFEGTTSTTYYVRIDGVGTGTAGVDTFEWSKDNFSTTEATGVDITGADQELSDNIKIFFNATTGHTSGDTWSGTASPINVDTGWMTNRNTGTTGVGHTHMGVFFDVTDEKFKFFEEYDPEPNGGIDINHATFNLGTVVASAFEGNITGNVTGSADSLTNGRTISITGDLSYTSGSFDGSSNVTGTGTIQTGSGTTIANYMQVANTNLLVNDRMQVANTVALTDALTTSVNDRMQVANTVLLVNDRMQVANTIALTDALTTSVNDRMQVANTVLLVNDRLQIANAEALYVSLSGDTMTGDLTLSGAPSADLHAATKKYVDDEVAGLVDSAPSTLDTLNELAAALGDNPNFATTVSTNLGQKLGATATVALTGDVTASATAFSSNAVSVATTLATSSGSSLANYMQVANTTLLVNDRMQVANTIALTNALTTSVNDRMQVANTNLLVNDRLQVANAEALYVSLSGDTMTGDLYFGDNDKAIFGAENDLEIYHDGASDSYIRAASGNLTILGSNYFGIGTGNLTYPTVLMDSSVPSAGEVACNLYYSYLGTESKKLATTSTGIDVTGKATIVENGASTTNTTKTLLTLDHYPSTTPTTGFGSEIEFKGKNPDNGASVYGSIAAVWEGTSGAGAGGTLQFKTDGYYGGNTTRMTIDSQGRVGIGTTTPSTALDIDGALSFVTNDVTASGASTTIDLTASNFHIITMNASTTFSFSNLSNAIASSGTIVIKQDSNGGRSFTLPAECKTPIGGASISQETGADTTSILSYIVVSASEVLVNYVGDFA